MKACPDCGKIDKVTPVCDHVVTSIDNDGMTGLFGGVRVHGIGYDCHRCNILYFDDVEDMMVEVDSDEDSYGLD